MDGFFILRVMQNGLLVSGNGFFFVSGAVVRIAEVEQGVLAQRETYKHLIELAKRKELIVEPEGEQLCLPNVD